MKVAHDTLKATIDNGAYAAMYDDTIPLDNALAWRLLTQGEHDDLVAYWHAKNDPEVTVDAGEVDSASGAVDSGAHDNAGTGEEPEGDVASQ